MRLFVIADPHIDFLSANILPLLSQMVDAEKPDALLCTGDISNTPEPLQAFLRSFTQLIPKYLLWGNHDLWAYKGDATSFQQEAQEAGWICPNSRLPYQVIDDILFVNLFYTPQSAWGWDGNDPNYSSDHRFFDVTQRTRPEVPLLPNPPNVRFSTSHMKPRSDLPSAYPPQYLFVNPTIDAIVRAHHSPLHIFGHTHEPLQEKREGVTYINHSFVDLDYRRRISNSKELIVEIVP